MTKEQKESEKFEQDRKGKIVHKSAFKSNNTGWKRLFSYYKPGYMIAIMFLLALMSSFAMPIVSFCITKLQFAYYAKDVDPDWESESTFLLILMASWITCLFFIAALEKGIFGVMGEKLTLKLRLMLIEEILHK